MIYSAPGCTTIYRQWNMFMQCIQYPFGMKTPGNGIEIFLLSGIVLYVSEGSQLNLALVRRKHVERRMAMKDAIKEIHEVRRRHIHIA